MEVGPAPAGVKMNNLQGHRECNQDRAPSTCCQHFVIMAGILGFGTWLWGGGAYGKGIW